MIRVIKKLIKKLQSNFIDTVSEHLELIVYKYGSIFKPVCDYFGFFN
jgi:hypothetical protein